MERVFFLAAHFLIFLTLWAGSISRVKEEFRSEIVRSCVVLFTSPVIFFVLGWGMDSYVLTDANDPKFLPTVGSVVGLFFVGAASVFFTMGFDYSGRFLAYVALVLSVIEFFLAGIHSAGIYKEILNVQAALTFAMAVTVLTTVISQQRVIEFRNRTNSVKL